MRWCTVPWRRSPLRWPCSANFWAFHGTLKFEEITIRPEIGWHNLVYHEGELCMKWPYSANVCIFWSRPVEGAVVLWLSYISLHIYQFMTCDCRIDIYASSKHWILSPYAVGTFSLRRSQNMYALNIAVAVAELWQPINQSIKQTNKTMISTASVYAHMMEGLCHWAYLDLEWMDGFWNNNSNIHDNCSSSIGIKCTLMSLTLQCACASCFKGGYWLLNDIT